MKPSGYNPFHMAVAGRFIGEKLLELQQSVEYTVMRGINPQKASLC